MTKKLTRNFMKYDSQSCMAIGLSLFKEEKRIKNSKSAGTGKHSVGI